MCECVRGIICKLNIQMLGETTPCGLSMQGFAPHISPFVQLRDLGGLLNTAGYSLTTIVRCIDRASVLTHGCSNTFSCLGPSI